MTIALLVTGTRGPLSEAGERRVESILVEAMRGGEGVLFVGDCPTGVDAIAARVASEEGWHVRMFKADWKAHGKAAGPKRNSRMVLDYATYCADYEAAACCLAFPAEVVDSRGTMDCVSQAARSGIQCEVYPVKVER